MKEPFQLRLPNSPSSEDSPFFTRDTRETLRPYRARTLRAWRSDQSLVASGLETFGLLPSPPLSDSHRSQKSPASTYFSPQSGSELEDDRGESDCACLPQTTSPQTPATDISDPDHQDGTTNIHMAHSTFVRQCELGNGRFMPATTDSGCMSPPTTCSDVGSVGKRNFSDSSAASQRSGSGTVSSEGSWVPSSLSYCETWLQGAPMDSAGNNTAKTSISNRRKFQIVQKSSFIPDWKGAHNDAVLAVKSKTKPKLVDISRQSSPAMNCSLPTPTHIIPATPNQSLPEVSAFSPETPLEMSDGGHARHIYSDSCEEPVDSKDAHTGLSSVGLGSVTETVAYDEAAENNNRLGSKHKSGPVRPIEPSSKSQTSPGTWSSELEREELEKWWDHEWTIDQLEYSVKDFPQTMLRLTSPVVMFLRHNHEKALIRPFRQIFSDSPELLLDSLCAVLIAKNYLLSLPSLCRRTVNLPPRAHFPKLDTVPEKASILGMKFAQPSPSRIRDQVLGSRSSKLHQDLDRIVDNLLFTMRGPPDEALKSAILVLIQVLETRT
ncbi:hypothetical protein BJX99DRAFT_242681 [Aspergillus californicus]